MSPSPHLVKKQQLLEALFPECSRLSCSWVRDMMKRRVIPFYKIGHGVWFDVEKVRAALEKKNLVRFL